MAATYCSVRRTNAAISCLLFLILATTSLGQMNLYITRGHFLSNLDLDLGGDIYLIKDGKASTLLTNPTAFKHFMSPLPEHAKEIEFTWRSHPLQIQYSFEFMSSNPDILATPRVSVAKSGSVPIYDKVFAVYLECSGTKRGVVEAEMRLNYTVDGKDNKLIVRVKKICGTNDGKTIDPGNASVQASSSSLSRGTIITIAISVTLFVCLLGSCVLYCCYQKRNQQLQIKFDSSYELGPKKKSKFTKIYNADLESADDLYIDDYDQPRGPIFIKKNKPGKKSLHRSRRNRRILQVPLEGTPPPAYTANPISPVSPGSSLRLLTNIPEELEDRQDDYSLLDERQPILMAENKDFVINVEENIEKNLFSNFSQEQPISDYVTIGNLKISKSEAETKETLYDILNRHLQAQFGSSVLNKNQVTVDKNALGKGTFGCVFCGSMSNVTDGSNAVQVAVKTLRGNADVESLSSFVNEAVLMRKMQHQHILPLLGVVLQNALPPMLVMPYMKFGDLNQFLRNARPTPKKPQSLSTRQLINFGYKTANAMEYVSSLNIVHRDLSTRNIMINEEYDVVIGDFGLAIELSSADEEIVSKIDKLPIKWSAIECITSRTFSQKSDVWSFGVCLWELMSLGKQPYSSIQLNDMENYLMHGKRLLQTNNCPNEIYEIMLSCWKHNPTERPTFSNLCSKLSTFEARYRQYSMNSRVQNGQSMA